MANRPPTRMLGRAAWSYFGYFWEALVGVFLVAYIVRRIGIADYGVFLFGNAVLAVLLLLNLGLPSILIQEYVESRQKTGVESVGPLLSTSFFFSLALGCLGLILCVGLGMTMPGPFSVAPVMILKARTVLDAGGITLLILLPTRTIETLYESFNRYDTLSKTQVLNATLRALAILYFLENGYGIIALAWIQTAISGVKLIILWLGIPRFIGPVRLRPSLAKADLLKPLRSQSALAFLDNIGHQLAMGSDSLVLALFGSMASVAVYGVGSKVPRHIGNVIHQGGNVALPALASQHTAGNIEEFRRIYLTACRALFGIILPAFLLFAYLSPAFVDLWVGTQYHAAAGVMIWLLVATLVQSLSFPSDLVLYARRSIASAVRITSLESLANLGLTAEQARCRIAAQMSADEKRRRADFLIDTSGTLDKTRRQVRELYPPLRHLAAGTCAWARRTASLSGRDIGGSRSRSFLGPFVVVKFLVGSFEQLLCRVVRAGGSSLLVR